MARTSGYTTLSTGLWTPKGGATTSWVTGILILYLFKLNKMIRRRIIQTVVALCLWVSFLMPTHSFGQTIQPRAGVPQGGNIYLNSETGNDLSTGTKDQPLKTLWEAARKINEANGRGAITLYLSEGIYGLDATITFHPVNWFFT